ncbi:unnamed protein product [Cylindrotheca closterium]|uniref:Ubiquitin-like domain-containing protein n=1 Tax=Cylindrotheca closterium TaxID=2856 RepID=A0AAD2FPC3_9STRA|nr:unnamed protein product [Cylindrotheca closterium]
MTSLTVHCSVTAENGKRVPITIEGKTTPTQLRTLVATGTKIPLSQLRLIFRGKMIKDDAEQDVVQEYKLEQDCVLHCMGKPSSDASVDFTATPAAAVSAPSVSMAAAASSAAPPAPAADPLQAALNLLRTNAASSQVYTTAVSTLNKVLENIISNPMEEKYRKVKVHNAAFGKRLGNLVGGRQAMLAVGFTQTTDEAGTQIYLLPASPEAWPALQQAKANVEAAVVAAKRVSDAAAATPSNNANPFGMAAPGGAAGGFGAAGGMPGLGAMPPGGMNNPMAQAAARNLMSNPQAMQQMLQNPMVQQMIQNDPNIPPHVRQTFQTLASNPAMMNQMAQLMNDPTTRAQMEAAMQSGGMGALAGMGGGGMPGGFGGGLGAGMGGGMPPMNNNANANNNSNNATGGGGGGGGGNDQAQTEEEMIAEAIRRSLQDNQ